MSHSIFWLLAYNLEVEEDIYLLLLASRVQISFASVVIGNTDKRQSEIGDIVASK